MKPIYLEFNGINSFSDKAEIDFRTLLSGGVFGIFGDTGSGKSTILDCIHLALYGQIERSSGSECINHRLDSAYVVFDFEITTDGVRHAYRVRRERRRKNNTAKAWLYEYTPTGELAALAEGTRDVNERLEEIIGLTFADFKMCIALPQGDFAALVKTKLGCPMIQYAGKRPVKTVALVGGGGGDFIYPALAAGADTLITGDSGYNITLDAADDGINVIQAGHYYTEAPVLARLADICRRLCGAECLFFDSNPIKVL